MLTQIWNATDIFFCHFMPFLAHLSHYGPQILTFGKNVKNTWRCYLFIHVHHKSRTNDLRFLRCKMPHGVNVLRRPALHPIFSYWVG